MGYKKWKLNPKVAPTMRAEHHNTASVHFIASGPTNGTNMPTKSTPSTSENATPETSELSTQKTSQTTISSVLAFLVNHLVSQEKLSRQYLGFSPIWGMSINGKFLIARISESLRTGKECSLSDILEKQVDQKYFLSAKATQFLIGRSIQNKQEGRGFRARLMPVMDPSEMPEKPTFTTSEMG